MKYIFLLILFYSCSKKMQVGNHKCVAGFGAGVSTLPGGLTGNGIEFPMATLPVYYSLWGDKYDKIGESNNIDAFMDSLFRRYELNMGYYVRSIDTFWVEDDDYNFTISRIKNGVVVSDPDRPKVFSDNYGTSVGVTLNTSWARILAANSTCPIISKKH